MVIVEMGLLGFQVCVKIKDVIMQPDLGRYQGPASVLLSLSE